MAENKSPYGFRYIGAKRRTKEDPRFVMGRGRYVADIALAGVGALLSLMLCRRVHDKQLRKFSSL